VAIENISILIGTRPEAIKLMPVIAALQKTGVKTSVFITGQHRELLMPILSELNVVTTENMELMEENQSLTDLSARILLAMQGVLKRHRQISLSCRAILPRRPWALWPVFTQA